MFDSKFHLFVWVLFFFPSKNPVYPSFSLCLFGTFPQSYLKVYFPGYIPQEGPQINIPLSFRLCIFFPADIDRFAKRLPLSEGSDDG